MKKFTAEQMEALRKGIEAMAESAKAAGVTMEEASALLSKLMATSPSMDDIRKSMRITLRRMTHPKTEDDIDAGVLVEYKGKRYETGNRRHEDVELYASGTGRFVQTVPIKDVEVVQ